MKKCEFYQSVTIYSNQVSTNRKPKNRRTQMICNHPDYKKSIFPNLTCGGDLDKCLFKGEEKK